MRAQVLNNCQGPHLLQAQKNGNLPAALVIIRPGLNLVDSKQLADLRKNPGVESLFNLKVKSSKSEEARLNSHNFGKPMLEVVGTELPDKAPLLGLKFDDALSIVSKTMDTDLLTQWQKECHPQKNQDLMQAISKQMKLATSDIASAG